MPKSVTSARLLTIASATVNWNASATVNQLTVAEASKLTKCAFKENSNTNYIQVEQTNNNLNIIIEEDSWDLEVAEDQHGVVEAVSAAERAAINHDGEVDPLHVG